MGKYQGIYPIVKKMRLTDTIYDIWVAAQPIAQEIRAGQFVGILCDGKPLRRPISICESDPVNGAIRLIFEVRGEGTHWLAQQEKGDKLDILGPLGNGFPTFPTDKKVVFVGGGIGVPPLLMTCKPFGKNADVYIGCRTYENRILIHEFQSTCRNVVVATEDGTSGIRGFVTLPLEKRLVAEPCDLILTCGPKPMMKAVGELAEKYGVACYVSMEERMGCGMGACLTCVCGIRDKQGDVHHRRVCSEGPVFNAKEVVW